MIYENCYFLEGWYGNNPLRDFVICEALGPLHLRWFLAVVPFDLSQTEKKTNLVKDDNSHQLELFQ
jgi:hypothetical protein